MSKEKERLKETSEEQLKRFSEAKKSLRKMQKEIAPFTKKKKPRHVSSIGEWRNTSDIIYDL